MDYSFGKEVENNSKNKYGGMIMPSIQAKLIAYLKDFKKVCKKYSVKLNVHIGKEMMHCWGGLWNSCRRPGR